MQRESASSVDPQFGQTPRDQVRDVGASLAAATGIAIERIAIERIGRSFIRKEEVFPPLLEQRR